MIDLNDPFYGIVIAFSVLILLGLYLAFFTKLDKKR